MTGINKEEIYMAHEHIVHDVDTQFRVNAAMEIICSGTVKALKQGDHASEVYSFSMPRYIEGHDMTLCNKVEVHYNNVHYDRTTETTTTNKSFETVTDLRVSEEDGDTVLWSWKVSGDATQLVGKLFFCVRFACLNGDMIEYQKFTETYDAIRVGESICNTGELSKVYTDAFERWKREIIANMPEITDQDEGKILRVVDGKAVWSNPEETTSGTKRLVVTIADGVDGQWTSTHTSAQIAQAIAAGWDIQCSLIIGVRLQLLGASEERAAFFVIYANVSVTVFIEGSQVTVETYELATRNGASVNV